MDFYEIYWGKPISSNIAHNRIHAYASQKFH